MDYVDEIVVDGFFNTILCSLKFMLENTEANTTTEPFYEAVLELQVACVTAWLGLVAWLSGRTTVFGRRNYSVLRSTCCRRVTTYVGKPSAIGQSTRPTQPFIPSGSIDE